MEPIRVGSDTMEGNLAALRELVLKWPGNTQLINKGQDSIEQAHHMLLCVNH